jgi:hypothetical protein
MNQSWGKGRLLTLEGRARTHNLKMTSTQVIRQGHFDCNRYNLNSTGLALCSSNKVLMLRFTCAEAPELLLKQ